MVDLYQILVTLAKINVTQGSIAKMELLNTLKESDEFRQLCKMLFDPMITFGIGAVPLPKYNAEDIEKSDEPLFPVLELMEALSRRDFTGHDARDRILDVINLYPESWRGWIAGLFNGAMPAGISDGSILKLYPDLYVVKELQLCSGFDENVLSNGRYHIEPKYDGLRCCFVKIGNTYQSLSRSFKPFFQENLAHIIPELKGMLDNGYAVDCEILAANWANTMSIAKCKYVHPDRLTLSANVFDYFPAEMIGTKDIFKKDYLSRRDFLYKNLFHVKRQYLNWVPSFSVQNMEQILWHKNNFIRSGYEGGVLKLVTGYYIFARGREWVKAKMSTRDDFKILDVVKGSGKYSIPPSDAIKRVMEGFPEVIMESLECAVGALVVEVNGTPTNVGTGFDDKTRYELMALHNMGHLVGRWAEIEFHSITPDNALREPSFQMLRIDK